MKEKSVVTTYNKPLGVNENLILKIASTCKTEQEFYEVVYYTFRDQEINEDVKDFITNTAKSLYKNYAPQSVQDFVGRASKSFQTAHEKYSDPNNMADMEKGVKEFGTQLAKAFSTAQQIIDYVGKPLGLSSKDMPFIISIVAAGASGGLGAIPYALIQYFVRKQIYGAAGKVYDKTFGVSQPETKTESLLANKYIMNLWESEDYLRKRELMRQRTAERMGSVAGAVTGTAKLAAGKIKEYLGQLKDLAIKNRVAIGKVIFLYGIGILIGMGTAKIHDLLTKKPQDDILKAMEYMGYNKKEIEELRELMKLTDKMVNDPSSMSPAELERMRQLNASSAMANLAHNTFYDDPNMQKAAYFAQQGDMRQAQFWQSQAAKANQDAFMAGTNDIPGPINYDGPKFSPQEVSTFMKNAPSAKELANFTSKPQSMATIDALLKKSQDVTGDLDASTIVAMSKTPADTAAEIDRVLGSGK